MFPIMRHQGSDLWRMKILGNLLAGESTLDTFAYDAKIARVQRALRWLEEDVPLLAMRVKDLSPERQKLAKLFAASMIDQARAELERLVRERTTERDEQDFPCEPAD
jgi:hypothetical protein